MNLTESIILGVVQGLTEFLPISSSGHLVLFQHMLGFREPQLLLDVSLHLGTLLAVCIYFFPDLSRMTAKVWGLLGRGPHRPGSLREAMDDPDLAMVCWIVAGSIPTALIGILFKDPLEKAFGSMSVVGVMLVVTGAILLATFRPAGKTSGRKQVGWARALGVGAAQGLAIIPGLSRSGTTIACGLLCGLDRELAGRFSFLLSIPAIVGALVLQLGSGGLEGVSLLSLIAGMAASTLVGLGALRVLMGVVRKGHLFYFTPYCWAAGALVWSLS